VICKFTIRSADDAGEPTGKKVEVFVGKDDHGAAVFNVQGTFDFADGDDDEVGTLRGLIGYVANVALDMVDTYAERYTP